MSQALDRRTSPQIVISKNDKRPRLYSQNGPLMTQFLHNAHPLNRTQYKE